LMGDLARALTLGRADFLRESIMMHRGAKKSDLGI
jgi:hypothetical protein